jgi:Rod binding domain-containing protein
MAEKIRSQAEKVKNGEKTFSVNQSEGETDSADSSSPSTEGKKNEELMEAANKVEGFFISFMMKQMRNTVKKTEGLFKRGQAEKMFQSRLDNKYADKIAKSKDFGLAESVYDQFSSTAVK